MYKYILVFIAPFLFHACTPNNVSINAEIGKKIDSAGMSGSFALMENGTEGFTIFNLSAYKDSAIAPLNTFFVLPTLIALDKGYIPVDSNKWISFDSSAYYNQVVAKIGRADLLLNIDTLHYGKGIVSADLENFWRDQSLVITPDEQLGLFKRIYFKELPYQKRSQEMLKKMILKESNANYQLSYVVATDSTKNNTTWVVGYVEENVHPYFFVLQTNAKDGSDLVNRNILLLKRILLQEGFLKGVR